MSRYILADPRCIWREGVKQPVDAKIYRSLFDVRREAPSDEVRCPYTRNPKPENLNYKPETRKPTPQTSTPKL